MYFDDNQQSISTVIAVTGHYILTIINSYCVSVAGSTTQLTCSIFIMIHVRFGEWNRVRVRVRVRVHIPIQYNCNLRYNIIIG